MPFRKRPGPTRPALPFTPPVGPYAGCRHRQQRIAAKRAASTDKRPGKNAPDIRRGNRVKRALQDRPSRRGSWSGLPEKDSRREAYGNDANYAVARRFSTPPSSAHALTTARHRTLSPQHATVTARPGGRRTQGRAGRFPDKKDGSPRGEPSFSSIARKRRAVGYAPAVCRCSRLRLRRRRLTRHSQVTTTSTAMPAKPSRAWGALKP